MPLVVSLVLEQLQYWNEINENIYTNSRTCSFITLYITLQGYKSLRQIFTPGQSVAVKVISIDANDKFRIGLSMMPQDVNNQLSHSSLVTGMILWGAISSKEEHGYVVDLGIQNSRAFLSKAFIDDGKEYCK